MRPIPNCPGYFADKDGGIYSMKSIGGNWAVGGSVPKVPRKLRGTVGPIGYRSVEFVIDGHRLRRLVGSLVCETFHGQRPRGLVCCHGPKGHCVDSASNVSWGTMEKNMGEDRRRDGTMVTKLSAKDIPAIRATDGVLSRIEAGKKFGITPEQVGHIVHRQQWQWVP